VLHGFDPQIVFYRINCTAANGASFIGFVQKLQQALEANTGTV
jgi:hypothetical protein